MYHSDRALHPKKYGLEYNSPKHTYSQGFYDGVNGYPSDVKAINKFYGKKSAYAYNIGRKMGLKNRF